VKGFFQERAVFDDSPVDGRVIHVDPTFEHTFFDMARTRGVGARPADPHQHNVVREMGPCEAERHRLSPPWQHGVEGKTIPQIATNENLRQNREAGPRFWRSSSPWVMLYPGPYLTGAFTFIAQPLFALAILGYAQKVFRDLQSRKVL